MVSWISFLPEFKLFAFAFRFQFEYFLLKLELIHTALQCGLAFVNLDRLTHQNSQPSIFHIEIGQGKHYTRPNVVS